MIGKEPSDFNGTYAENAKKWIRYMDIWTSLQSRQPHTERDKISLTALYLKSDVETWYHSLNFIEPMDNGDPIPPGATVATYAAFRHAFIDKFRPEPSNQLIATQSVFTCKQRPGQSTESFCSEIREKEETALVPQLQILHAARAGLSNRIKAR